MSLNFDPYAKNAGAEDHSYRDRCKAENLDTKILHYPHIPKTVATLLKELYPRIYRSAAVTFHVREGTWVKRESVIGTYGKIKITAPYEGRIERLGNPFQAGKHEWYSTQGGAIFGDPRDKNRMPSMEGDSYIFSMRATLNTPDKRYEHTSPHIAHAFDNGRDGAEEVGLFGGNKGHPTFMSLLDDAAAHAKGMPGRTRVPDSLIKDHDFREHLIRYWALLFSGSAGIADISRSNSLKPHDPYLG